jgi:hypothetical protein
VLTNALLELQVLFVISSRNVFLLVSVLGLSQGAPRASRGVPGAESRTVSEALPAKNTLALPCVPRNQCCRICTAGHACGNWCTKAIFNCAKARGCACDASKVCRTGSR